MTLFQKILVAADFSESSLQAFRVACSLARADETRMIVLHVVEPHYVAEEPVYFGQPTVQYSVVERDPGEHELLQRQLRECYVPDHPLEVEYRTQDGTASEEILSSADELACDLIVMGTHGRTGLDRLLTGSVAEAVLRKARCPVLALRSPNHLTAMPEASDEAMRSPGTIPGVVVPSQSIPPQEQEPARLPIQTILYPTDFSEPSEAALSVARSFAHDQGARLIILHVAPVELAGGGPLVPMDPRFYQDAIEEVRRRLNGSDLNYHVETRLRQGDAAEEILSLAAELGCDLIVMGSHGRSGLGRLLMGSVAEAVLRGARCPVLTVKVPQAATNVVTTAPQVQEGPQWSGFGP
jgi:nucleotide-binding universal stress UspA family protein